MCAFFTRKEVLYEQEEEKLPERLGLVFALFSDFGL